MTSTPSASALTAVLRCRGNIWARNPPVGRAVAVKRASLRADGGGALREEGCGGTDRAANAKVSEEDARTAACCGPLVRQLALQLTSPPSGPDRRAQIVRAMRQSCKIVLVVGGDQQQQQQQQPGVIRVSASSCWTEDAVQIPCLVVTGWDALKGSCSSGTELVAQLVLRKLAVLCGSSCGRKDAPRLLRRQDVLNGGLQANGQNLSNNRTGPKVTGDKPD